MIAFLTRRKPILWFQGSKWSLLVSNLSNSLSNCVMHKWKSVTDRIYHFEARADKYANRLVYKLQYIRYADVIWLLSLMGCLYLIGVSLGGEHRTNTIKACLEEIGLRLQIFINYCTLKSDYNSEDLSMQLESTSMHFQYPWLRAGSISIWFLLMFSS